jgi:sodium transport system permease protein
MNLRAAWVVFAKEATDNQRDRRSLATALLMPLMGPLSLLLLFVMFSDIKEKTSAPKVPVVGRELAPNLVAHLEADGVIIEEPPADPVAAVRRGVVDVVLIIPPDFPTALGEGRPAVLEVIADPSRQSSAVTLQRLQAVVGQQSAHVGALRLLARGIDPLITAPMAVSVRDVSSPQGKMAMLLGVVPLFLLLACFMGGTYVAIDVTAGERERGSLEALLLNPVRPLPLVLGKVALTSLAGLLSLVVAAVGFVVAVVFIPFEKAGFDLQLPPLLALGMIAALLPVVVLGGALQVFVGTMSRSFKTAQAAISAIMILPSIPGTLVLLFPQQPTAGLLAIPTLGHCMLLLRELRGDETALWHYAVAQAPVVVLAAVLVLLTARLFGPRLLHDG